MVALFSLHIFIIDVCILLSVVCILSLFYFISDIIFVFSDKPITAMIQLDMYKSQAAECRGEKLTEIIKQATEANDLYFFGEFLELPSVRELENDPLGSPYYRLLNLFTYGTCKDYMNQAASFPALTEPMMIKLRHLTLASLATKNKLIPYSTLLDELNIETIRELEDLLISAIYANVIGGKLDQQCAGLEVDWTIGRDIKTGSLDYVSESLESWSV